MRSRVLVPPLVLLLAATVVACGGGRAATAPELGASTSADDHGAIAGAVEVGEPQLGLTTVDPSGTVSHLDLLDESVSRLGTVDPPRSVTTDGRYLFAQNDSGVQIVDSGVWTWDHVDHFHYYRAAPRMVGSVRGTGVATVATTNLSTSGGTGMFFPGSGDAVLLDTEALAQGRIAERFRLSGRPHAGLVVPIGSFALVTEAHAGVAATVVGYTADGRRTGLVEKCAAAAGTITTRVGAVIGCSDGVLLASVRDGRLAVERIPYPTNTTAPPATSFSGREGRPTVAALAGTEGIWLLDTRNRSWDLIPAPTPLLAVSAVDDRAGHVLAVSRDGRVIVLDGEDGAVLARTSPLVSRSIDAGAVPQLVVDQQRAYLSAPMERRLHEIDFADNARVARTFTTSTEPVFTAGTGR